ARRPNSSGLRTPICTATRLGILSPLRLTGHLPPSPSGALESCSCGRGSDGMLAAPTGPLFVSGPVVTHHTALAPTALSDGSRASAAGGPCDRRPRPRPSGRDRERRGRTGQAPVEEEPRAPDLSGSVTQTRANARTPHRPVVGREARGEGTPLPERSRARAPPLCGRRRLRIR